MYGHFETLYINFEGLDNLLFKKGLFIEIFFDGL